MLPRIHIGLLSTITPQLLPRFPPESLPRLPPDIHTNKNYSKYSFWNSPRDSSIIFSVIPWGILSRILTGSRISLWISWIMFHYLFILAFSQWFIQIFSQGFLHFFFNLNEFLMNSFKDFYSISENFFKICSGIILRIASLMDFWRNPLFFAKKNKLLG